MDQEAFQKHLRQVFLTELDEHLQALERDLLAFEAAAGHGQQALIESLFRTVHTLKGAAHAVGHSLLEKVAHALESLFMRARGADFGLDAPRMQLLFVALDAIRDAGARERAGLTAMDDPAGALARLLPDLDALFILDTDMPSPVEVTVAAPLPALAQAPAPAPAPAPASTPTPTPGEPVPGESRREKNVRLPAARVERMLTLGGELLLTRQRLAARLSVMQGCLDNIGQQDSPQGNAGAGHGTGNKLASQMRELLAALTRDRRALDQVAEPLEQDILSIGMAPFSEACEGLGRVVRDLGQETGKQVQLFIEGGDINIDRAIVEGLRDPLLHLVRNAMAHGVESPEQRQQLGKPLRGSITVSADLRWGGVEVAVADDGSGLDLRAIRARLADGGVGNVDDSVDGTKVDGTKVDDSRLINRIFAPGFSTRREVSQLAGRGVGLDLVNTAANRLRGTVRVDNRAGMGLRIALQLPHTLSVLKALLVVSEQQRYAIDAHAVEYLLRINPGDLTRAEGHDTLVLNGEVVRVFHLPHVLHGVETTMAASEYMAGKKVPALLLRSDAGRALFIVDELLEEMALPVKSLGPRFRQLQLLVGATLLEGDQVTLLLHAPTLIRRALDLGAHHSPLPASTQATRQRKRLLVAEDSLSTRTLMKGILEQEQFTVLVAEDGLQAWQILQREAVDLLVSDVEMPNMDGFALTEAVRNSSRFKSLPVILVTALKTDQDRLRGMQAGADAYLVKSSFDQSELLAAIHQLL